MSTNTVHEPLATGAVALMSYVLDALQQHEPQPIASGLGLPEATLDVVGANLVLSVTSAAAPLFRPQIAAVSAARRCDVVLVRTVMKGAAQSVSVDVALDAPIAMLTLADLRFARIRDGGLWLLAPQPGPCVSIGATGLLLHMSEPTATLWARSEAIDRATREIACLRAGVR